MRTCYNFLSKSEYYLEQTFWEGNKGMSTKIRGECERGRHGKPLNFPKGQLCNTSGYLYTMIKVKCRNLEQ